MRIKVYHETVYQFATPARSVLQVLRLTPRNFDGQHVASWRIDVDTDCRLTQDDDAFGNITHTFSAEGPIARLSVLVEGEVETFDTSGVLRGSREPFPAELFLRATNLTTPEPEVVTFARDASGNASDTLGKLHALMQACKEAVAFESDAHHHLPAEALAAGKADSAGLANLFVTCARMSGAPARCVSGYLLRKEPAGPESLHIWAEAHVEGLGWVGFDPAHCLATSDRHIRIACALDHLGAAPVRSVQAGNPGDQKIDVRVVEAQAQWQWQS
jgi:transglutaminase-like putative cysteine protease